MQLDNKHMKKCSPSLNMKEVHFKMTMRYHFTPTRMAKIKRTITRTDKDVKKLKTSHIAGRGCKMVPLLR